MAMFDLFKDEKKLVTFALILIIILGIITYNLYLVKRTLMVMNMDVLIQ